MNSIKLLLAAIFLSACTTSSPPKTSTQNNPRPLQRVIQELVRPPFVPKHEQIATGNPKIVQVRLVAEEKEIEIAEDVMVQASTFNGSVPGPLIVVHQDDYVELTLVNPKSNTYAHNIDFHAATGALGT